MWGLRRFSTVVSSVRVRYAPSPTGFLHLGGLRTALYNYVYAQQKGGTFILRIEDTDKSRQVEGSVEGLIKAMKWCGLHHQEGPYLIEKSEGHELQESGNYGPYVQSSRLDTYRLHAETLLEKGKAYRCFCTPERLTALREAQAKRGQATVYDRACAHLPEGEAEKRAQAGEPHVIRMRVPTGQITLNDLVLGEIRFPHTVVDDQVLMKSDGFPTYHLASVVDDHLMKVSHVIRGQEWLASAPKHLLLYQAFGWEPPNFAHLPLLLNVDRSKLSKRQGDAAVEDFAAAGYLPEALVNFVALLGWSPSAEDQKLLNLPVGEVLTLPDIIQLFKFEALHKANAIVDRARLNHLNNEHIRRYIIEAIQASNPACLSEATEGQPPRIVEGKVPLSIPDTEKLKFLKSLILPKLALAVSELRPKSAFHLIREAVDPLADSHVREKELQESSSVVYRTTTPEQLNAYLAAQHERVGPLTDFVPLVLPFLVSSEAKDANIVSEFEALLNTAESAQSLVKVALNIYKKSKPDLITKEIQENPKGHANTLFSLVYNSHSTAFSQLRNEWKSMAADIFDEEGGLAALRKVAKSTGTPAGALMQGTRFGLTGMDVGANLTDVMRLLGRDECVRRLEYVLNRSHE